MTARDLYESRITVALDRVDPAYAGAECLLAALRPPDESLNDAAYAADHERRMAGARVLYEASVSLIKIAKAIESLK